MALQNTAQNSAAFDRPGGETSGSPRSRPINLAHLARQTLGDRAVEQEVLQMFVCQALLVRDRILQASAKERFHLAHGLKGSARGIGAFALADCAGEIEARPEDRSALNRLTLLIDEVRDFIAAINR
jgi:HPt (histidine-containing phosphotransfer) domain-containing protein